MTPSAPARTKPVLTPAERRRRRERRAWIPTFVIAGVIAGAVVVAVVLQITGVFTPVTSSGESKFTIAGVKVINGAADVQIDVREPLTAQAVGLPANSTRTIGPFNGIELEVDLVGTSGVTPIFVDSMRVVTRDGYVRSVTTATHDFGYLFIRNEISALRVLGLTSRQMTQFENAMPNGAGDEHSFFQLPFGTGDALGVPTSVTVGCAGPKGCTVTTLTTLLQKSTLSLGSQGE